MNELKNRKNLINIAIVIILIVGLGIGFYLSQNQQILRGRAFGSPPLEFIGPSNNLVTLSGGRIGLKVSEGQTASVELRLTSPFGAPGTGSIQPTQVQQPTQAQPTSTPQPTAVQPSPTITPQPTSRPTATTQPASTTTPFPTTAPGLGPGGKCPGEANVPMCGSGLTCNGVNLCSLNCNPGQFLCYSSLNGTGRVCCNGTAP